MFPVTMAISRVGLGAERWYSPEGSHAKERGARKVRLVAFRGASWSGLSQDFDRYGAVGKGTVAELAD